ncbi:MAG TPA: hypothetical protein VI757_10630 [Bacteroidia bacterium]|nr:hypothetical protein [Bacteroidia bacterium]
MRKLSKEEVAGLPMLKQGRRTKVNIQISQLKPGEILIVDTRRGLDWQESALPLSEPLCQKARMENDVGRIAR